jgi:hypothetical protein
MNMNIYIYNRVRAANIHVHENYGGLLRDSVYAFSAY